jgi:hypothetical protein
MFIDVFNGDADGICALHQLRLLQPRDSRLITGVKRDIKLLQSILDIENADITVLDISMDSNSASLLALLENNNHITYFDHHFAGDIPDSKNLFAVIDPSPVVCTSSLVDQHIKGRFRPWAVCAAFGDNLHQTASKLAQDLLLSAKQLAQLRELGELLNYNGYGEKLEDLHFHPAELYRAIQPFENPLTFYEESPVLATLKQGFSDDMANAQAQLPMHESSVSRVFSFPSEPWSKRVAGVFSNAIAREQPDRAHALLADNGDDSYLVSVRAPLRNPMGADELCRQFDTGGGRQAAAGINRLPQDQVDSFLTLMESQFAS